MSQLSKSGTGTAFATVQRPSLVVTAQNLNTVIPASGTLVLQDNILSFLLFSVPEALDHFSEEPPRLLLRIIYMGRGVQAVRAAYIGKLLHDAASRTRPCSVENVGDTI